MTELGLVEAVVINVLDAVPKHVYAMDSHLSHNLLDDTGHS